MAVTSNHNRTGGITLGAQDGGVEAPQAVDPNGYIVLSRRQCTDRLRGVTLGRVAVSMRALPVILPVRFALMDEDVVFRTASGARLSSCCDHAVVAFEADAYDPCTGHGWSVCVTGMASLLTEPLDILRAWDLGLPSIGASSNGHGGVFVRIRGDIITGRQTPGLEVSPL